MKVTLPDSQQSISSEDKATTSWFTFFQDIYRAVRGDLGISIGGNISVKTTAADNSGSGETNLISYSVPANLTTTGDELYLKAWGVFAANANNKTLKLKFGSQTILTSGAIAANGGSWQIEATILRTGAATQEIIASLISGNSSVTELTTRTAGTQTLSTSNILLITGQGTSSSDITQNAMIVKLTPNN
mgnify:FL=1|tara:strand:- start:939 stop:1505 length:567 start_codon:yes stop_codon:yes gene_type:complete